MPHLGAPSSANNTLPRCGVSAALNRSGCDPLSYPNGRVSSSLRADTGAQDVGDQGPCTLWTKARRAPGILALSSVRVPPPEWVYTFRTSYSHVEARQSSETGQAGAWTHGDGPPCTYLCSGVRQAQSRACRSTRSLHISCHDEHLRKNHYTLARNETKPECQSRSHHLCRNPDFPRQWTPPWLTRAEKERCMEQPLG